MPVRRYKHILIKKIYYGTVYTTINSDIIVKIDNTLSTFVYLLLAALHISILFLGHPLACIVNDTQRDA
jgi:hypothetical protein